MTTLRVNMSVDSVAPTGDYSLMTFASPDAPTRAEVERLARERWHTRPDWWINGTTPKNLIDDVADLPAGMTYDATNNVVNVTGDVAALDGWDFAITWTILSFATGRSHGTWSNCKFAPPGAPKSERMNYLNENGWNPSITCWEFGNADNTTTFERLFRLWFSVSPEYEGGAFNGTACINGNSPSNSGYPRFDLMEYCSIEGHGQDGIKSSVGGKWRYIYFDCQTGVPPDGELWQSGKTYFLNDVVWGPPNQSYLRICQVASTTQSPNFAAKDNSTTDWRAIDPHGDHYQSGQSAPDVGDVPNVEILGCFYNSDMTKYRGETRGYVRGIASNGFRKNTFNVGNRQGGTFFHHNIMPREVELAFSGQVPLSFTTGSVLWPGNEVRIEDNHYNSDNGLITNSSGGILNRNTGGWDWWAPATLSGVSAVYFGGSLVYGYSASLGGWATVVLSTSPTAMTAEGILTASVGGAVLAKYEIDAPANTTVSKAETVALSVGTYYAHMLYQAGGGIYTLAPVQTVTVS